MDDALTRGRSNALPRTLPRGPAEHEQRVRTGRPSIIALKWASSATSALSPTAGTVPRTLVARRTTTTEPSASRSTSGLAASDGRRTSPPTPRRQCTRSTDTWRRRGRHRRALHCRARLTACRLLPSRLLHRRGVRRRLDRRPACFWVRRLDRRRACFWVRRLDRRRACCWARLCRARLPAHHRACGLLWDRLPRVRLRGCCSRRVDHLHSLVCSTRRLHRRP